MKFLISILALAALAGQSQAVEVTVQANVKTNVQMYVGRINAFGMIADQAQPFAYNPEAARFGATPRTVPMQSIIADSAAEVLLRLAGVLTPILNTEGFNPRDIWMAVSIRQENNGAFQMAPDIGERYNVATLQAVP